MWGAYHKPSLINIVPQHNTNNVTRKFNIIGNAPLPYMVKLLANYFIWKLLLLNIMVVIYPVLINIVPQHNIKNATRKFNII